MKTKGVHERMKEEESGAKGPGRTAGYGLYILPLESFLMISQVEMIGYIVIQRSEKFELNWLLLNEELIFCFWFIK